MQNSCDLWKRLKVNRENADITALTDSQGNTIDKPEKLKASIQSFLTELGRCRAPEPINLNQVGTTITDHARVLNTNIEEEFTKKVFSKEYDNAIKGRTPHKASCFDGIANKLLKEGGEHLQLLIILLVYAIIESEWVPPTQREERVTLLHQGGSKISLDSYRTISIGSNFGKLFTRILQTRMQTPAESAGWLGDIQNGWSTMDSLFILTQVMEQALRKQTKVFLCGGKGCGEWQSSRDSEIRVPPIIGGWTESMQCFICVKQGCVLSPILFALFVAEIEMTMGYL